MKEQESSTGLILPGHLRTKGGEGSDALSIKEAPRKAEVFLDVETNGLRDDSAFVPMGDRILVRRVPEAVKAVGGIHLPDTGKTPAAFGVVVGVGQGRYSMIGTLIPVRVRVGAVVMFGKYAGTDVQIFGLGAEEGKCVSLREEEIMGVIMSRQEAEENCRESDPEIVPVAK